MVNSEWLAGSNRQTLLELLSVMSVPQLGSSRAGGFSVAKPHLRYRGTRGGAGGGWGGWVVEGG